MEDALCFVRTSCTFPGIPKMSETSGEENLLLEILRKAEVPLDKELVGAVVDAELFLTSPHHPELFDAGRHQ